jgi:uncharacterized repeat protein (TIGR03803 family)
MKIKMLNVWLVGVLTMMGAKAGANAGPVVTTLVSFFGTNGSIPLAGLIQAKDGNFYGTTSAGGTNHNPSSYGTIFKMSAVGIHTLLYSFTGTNDGIGPDAALAEGGDGNFYGSTYQGGATVKLISGAFPSGGFGTLFKIGTNGVLTTLVSFNDTNSAYPSTGNALVKGYDGGIYGTTYGGNYDGGVAFRVTTNGEFSNLAMFTNRFPGANPRSLLLGKDCNFYGITGLGGQFGLGAVFQFMTNGMLNTLVSFDGTNGWNSPNSFGPPGRNLSNMVQDQNGVIYGATYNGGQYYPNGPSLGSVFKLETNGTLSAVAYFQGTNGINPNGIVLAADGNLYGTTLTGGEHGSGTIFEIVSNSFVKTLYSFAGQGDGGNPNGLIQGNDGNFYGTTQSGGASIYGTVFRFSLPLQPIIQKVVQTTGTITFTWNSVAGQNYQAQYSTDLNSTNWNNLSSSVIATNGAMSASDSLGLDAQRYYRVALLP